MRSIPYSPGPLWLCSAIAAVIAACLQMPAEAQGALETITNTAAVQALTAAEAAEARPVRLRVVVVSDSYPPQRSLIVADESGGLYVLATNNILAAFKREDLVELSGVTDPGQFAPILSVTNATKVGTAPLPAPRSATYQELVSGGLDAQWIELSGVVQVTLSVPPGSGFRRIILSVDGNPVHVRMSDGTDPGLEEDAEVRVRGLCFYQFNQKRQMLTPVVQVPPGIPVTIVKPAPAEPFSAPVRPVASLLLFSPREAVGHRLHVRGVVVHSQPGSYAWIRDDSAGLRFETQSPEPLRPGDLIDVLGFPKYGVATPALEAAVFRKLGSTNPPAPIALTNPTNAFDRGGELVSLEAQLADLTLTGDALALSLEAGGMAFSAVLKSFAPGKTAPAWQSGSRVRVAGICSVKYDENRPLMGIWHPESFQLLLRSPADLTILRPPPWWTPRHVIYGLGAALGVTLAITGVITLLARRRLREQELHRAMAEAEFAAILSERNRVAREIHDTLAQGLVATSVQLRLAKKSINGATDALTRHLDSAQEMVRGSLEEARSTIWNMRSQVLETGDLPRALANILKQMADGSELRTEFNVTGRARRLAPVIENNVLRLGQEAITNATKHAQARNLRVSLEFGEREFCLAVRDDGRGFDTANASNGGGGFGLVGMRERATELKGALDVRSRPGEGTEVLLRVPLAAE
jgi:signal transduction histidine kinase